MAFEALNERQFHVDRQPMWLNCTRRRTRENWRKKSSNRFAKIPKTIRSKLHKDTIGTQVLKVFSMKLKTHPSLKHIKRVVMIYLLTLAWTPTIGHVFVTKVLSKHQRRRKRFIRHVFATTIKWTNGFCCLPESLSGGRKGTAYEIKRNPTPKQTRILIGLGNCRDVSYTQHKIYR